MFKNGIQAVHYEPTARCNAKCPMCSRTGNAEILSDQGEIGIDQFKKTFPPSIVEGLIQFKFCGNYGDPILAKDLILMHQYLVDINPDILLLLSTNGGTRTSKFWKDLGEVYKKGHPNSHVQFHIDGLEDTNHIYRVGVVWSKLMSNVRTYLDTGALGAWFFIPFFHNEMQVEEARSLSTSMGFQQFIVKISARFSDPRKAHRRDGVTTFPPINKEYDIQDLQINGGKLVCFAEVRKEIYIDAWNRLHPCCWVGSSKSSWPDSSLIDLNKRSLEDIHNDPDIDSWINKMYNNPCSVCNKRCTGQQQHVLEIDGVQRPQKELWGNVRRVSLKATDRS